MNSEENKMYQNYDTEDNTSYNNDPFMIKHRKRTSKKQLELLEKTFETCIRPDSKTRKRLGDQLNMTPRAVQIWFQNRRAKIKKLNGDYKTTKKKILKKTKKIETPNSFYGNPYSNVYANNQYMNNGLYGEFDLKHQEAQYDITRGHYDGEYYQNMYNKSNYDVNQYYNDLSQYRGDMYGSMTNPYYYPSTSYKYTDENDGAVYSNVDEYYYKMQQNNGYYYCDENMNENREDFVDRREE